MIAKYIILDKVKSNQKLSD